MCGITKQEVFQFAKIDKQSMISETEAEQQNQGNREQQEQKQAFMQTMKSLNLRKEQYINNKINFETKLPIEFYRQHEPCSSSFWIRELRVDTSNFTPHCSFLIQNYRMKSIFKNPHIDLEQTLPEESNCQEEIDLLTVHTSSKNLKIINGFDVPNSKWLNRSIIFAKNLELDYFQPIKINSKFDIHESWKGVNSLCIFDIKQQIWKLDQRDKIYQFFQQRLYPYRGIIQLEHIKCLFLKGKKCVYIRFHDAYGAAFAYFNFYTSFRGIQSYFADANHKCEILRAKVDKVSKNWQSSEIIFSVKRAPPIMNKETFQKINSTIDIKVNVEEFLQIGKYKYSIGTVKSIEKFGRVVKQMKKREKETEQKIKLNMHPNSQKIWERIPFAKHRKNELENSLESIDL